VSASSIDGDEPSSSSFAVSPTCGRRPCVRSVYSVCGPRRSQVRIPSLTLNNTLQIRTFGPTAFG